MSDTTRQPRTPLEWAKHVRRYDLTPSAPNPLAEVIEQQAAQIEALRADAAVWKEQVDSLRNALVKVLDTRNKEAKATMSYQTARENFSDSTDERKAQERAMLAASDAEREARTLLLTLKKIPGAALRQEQPAGEGEK